MKTAVGILCTLLLVSSAAAAQPVTDQPVYKAGNGVTLPKALKEVKPGYTAAAKKNKIQGSVALECVVRTDGTPTKVRVAKSLDKKYGLDDAAVKALKQWQFEPGTKDGKPVPVQVTVELTFTLR